jgi:hypothetical protein
LWHTSYALGESKIVIYNDVASGGAHHFTGKFHIMWYNKQVSAQYLEYRINSPFWCGSTKML